MFDKKEFDEEITQLLKCGCELVDNGYEIVKKNKRVDFNRILHEN